MQFKEFAIRRELNKAYCGFFSTADDGMNIPIATGNWGCGAFRGYSRLKCLIQLMACVASKRILVYYTFNDYELQLEMEEMFEFLQQNDITIAQLWKYLISFNAKNEFSLLYHHIHEQFLADKELEGLENLSEFDKNSEELLEARTVEGSCSTDDVDKLPEESPNIEESKTCHIETTSEKDLNQSGEVLENPTKRMKIDDDNLESSKKDESNVAEIIKFPSEPPPKNKLITDFFTKKTN